MYLTGEKEKNTRKIKSFQHFQNKVQITYRLKTEAISTALQIVLTSVKNTMDPINGIHISLTPCIICAVPQMTT